MIELCPVPIKRMQLCNRHANLILFFFLSKSFYFVVYCFSLLTFDGNKLNLNIKIETNQLLGGRNNKILETF